MTDCLFCRIVAGEIDAKLVEEGKEWIAFRDVNPQAPVHVLIVPREHVATANDLEERHQELLGAMVRGAARIAAAHDIDQEGYRLVLNTNPGAGQSVFHVHLHLLGGRHLSWPPG
ncbi:MAG TPA: histidine triad nucleotide-binding protein [Gemmatimonadota bacterium]|nr:histidine triad nucleotide-binding protein [Gemmatimonadota bacterium]